MKLTFVAIALLLIMGAGWWYYQALQTPPAAPAYVANDPVDTEETRDQSAAIPAVEVIAENLTVPWEVVFLPDGELLVTQRPGTLLLLKEGISIPVEGVRHVGEGGLLGAALHPDFSENNWLYLYQTTETENGLRNRVNRYELVGSDLRLESTVVDDLPGARYHDGGRIAFGPDGYLYVALGDAGNEPAALDEQLLEGSILRYTADGAIPSSNPYGNAVYSYGHRNPQGLAWDDAGRLWSSEHGRSGASSGFDEINLIEAGANYGWPESEGDEVADGTYGPVRHSGTATTWAPGDIVYHDGSLYMPGLRGRTLYEAVLDGSEIIAWHEHVVEAYGRLRTVVVGPDGLLYLTTSNRDGRGVPASTDDRLIRIDPAQLDRS